MAGTANDCRLKFKSWNGLKEGVQVDRAIVNPYNRLTHRHLSSKTTAWCAIACVEAQVQGGIQKSKVYKSSGCSQQMAWFKKKKRFKKRGVKPQASWLVFYNFKKTKKAGVSTHMGMVTSTDTKKKGYMYVIEGNKNNKVAYRHISYSSKDIIGYGIPYYKK